MALVVKQAQKQIFEGKCQDLTHRSLFSEMGECLFLSPVLYLCSAKDEVEEQAYYINSSCKQEDISPAKLWILTEEKSSHSRSYASCYMREDLQQPFEKASVPWSNI